MAIYNSYIFYKEQPCNLSKDVQPFSQLVKLQIQVLIGPQKQLNVNFSYKHLEPRASAKIKSITEKSSFCENQIKCFFMHEMPNLQATALLNCSQVYLKVLDIKPKRR